MAIHVDDMPIFRFLMKDQDNAVVDLTGATTLEVDFEDPDGTVTTQTGALTNDGSDGLFQWAATSAFLATAGEWVRQPHVVTAAGKEFRGDQVVFTVYPTLTT